MPFFNWVIHPFYSFHTDPSICIYFAYFREKCIISHLSLVKAFLKFLISFNSRIINAKTGLSNLEVFYLVANLYQNYMMLWGGTPARISLNYKYLNPTDYMNIFIVSTFPCFPSFRNNLKFNLICFFDFDFRSWVGLKIKTCQTWTTAQVRLSNYKIRWKIKDWDRWSRFFPSP